MSPKILFYVQHLLGIGHVVRGMRIARGLLDGGFLVDLVLGGVPFDGLDAGGARITQLPPVKAAPAFSSLVGLDGAPFGEAEKAARRDALLALFDRCEPDVLLIEAFPFARRQMDFELLPLLDHAKAAPKKPIVAVSVRDILQRKSKPRRAAEAAAIVREHVDAVLVHGDPRLGGLGDTFPLADAIADRTHYTGLVGPHDTPEPAPVVYEVVVSAGGGAVGAALIRAALAARPLTRFRDAAWLIVTGPNFSEGDLPGLPQDGVTVARFIPDLARYFRGAALSISQAGYNTVADLMGAGCARVLVPFAADGETEQTDRAALLEARGLAIHLAESALDAVSLAEAVDKARALPRMPTAFHLGGAAATADILTRLLQRRQPSDGIF